jgi:hypothetical protein
MEGNKEFRIYCEDSGWLILGSDGPGVIVTAGFAKMLEEAHTDEGPRMSEGPKGLPQPTSQRARRKGRAVESEVETGGDLSGS